MLDRECPLEQSSERPANRLRSRRGLPPLANLRDAQYQKLRQLTEKTFSVIKNTGKDGGLPLPLGDERGSYIAQFPSTSSPGVWENEYANLALAETIGIEGPAVAQTTRGSISRILRRCSAYALTANYEGATYHDIAAALNIAVSSAAAAEFVRRLALAAITGNGDVNLKN